MGGHFSGSRPRTRRMRMAANATSSSRWMYPFSVYDETMPTSHSRTNRMAMVSSMAGKWFGFRGTVGTQVEGQNGPCASPACGREVWRCTRPMGVWPGQADCTVPTTGIRSLPAGAARRTCSRGLEACPARVGGATPAISERTHRNHWAGTESNGGGTPEKRSGSFDPLSP